MGVKTSGDFNPALVSEISSSLVSQYIREVKPIPSSGIRGDTKCVYDVSVTSDEGKTFVSLRGEGINSFGDSSLEGTDGFQQSILRSIYRSQRDKRELICSDYPKILEECGVVVRKKKPEVVKLSSPKKVKPRVSVTKEKVLVPKVEPKVVDTSSKKSRKNADCKKIAKLQKNLSKRMSECRRDKKGCKLNKKIKRKLVREFLKLKTMSDQKRCNSKPVEKTKPKKKGNWECIVPPCDFIDKDGNLIED